MSKLCVKNYCQSMNVGHINFLHQHWKRTHYQSMPQGGDEQALCDQGLIYTLLLNEARREAWLRVNQTVNEFNTVIRERNLSTGRLLIGIIGLSMSWLWWFNASIAELVLIPLAFSLSIYAGTMLGYVWTYAQHLWWIRRNNLELGYATQLFFRPIPRPTRKTFYKLFDDVLMPHEEYLHLLHEPGVILTNLTHALWYYELTYRALGYRVGRWIGQESEGGMIYRVIPAIVTQNE